MPAEDLQGEAHLTRALEEELRRAHPVLLISPPRGNSSVFATALGRSPRISRYVHEPCGRYYYQGLSVSAILEALGPMGPGILIKEMSFQMRHPPVARAFLRGCRAPIIFLLRSPLLTIESRLRLVLTERMHAEATPPPTRDRIREAIASRCYAGLDDLLTEDVFPTHRTGWDDLGDQLRLCREEGIEHLIVETSDFRRAPTEVLSSVCDRLGLQMDASMLSWEAGSNRLPGALDDQAVWYERVTTSTGIEPPSEALPSPEDLPVRFREHLPEAMAIYRGAMSAPGVRVDARE